MPRNRQSFSIDSFEYAMAAGHVPNDSSTARDCLKLSYAPVVWIGTHGRKQLIGCIHRMALPKTGQANLSRFFAADFVSEQGFSERSGIGWWKSQAGL
jgi:hypothetical protein